MNAVVPNPVAPSIRSHFRIPIRTSVTDCGGSVTERFSGDGGRAAIVLGLSADTRHIFITLVFTGPDGDAPENVSGAVTVAFGILLTKISVKSPERLSVAA